jgi:RNA polymerase sigma-70 factor (ECF subfamily)
LDDLQQLIQDCAANNRLSQEKLYRKFYPALILLCKRFFEDNHEALEVLNDGMLKVYKNIASYQSAKGDFFNWVYTIIRNTALDRLKLVKIPAARQLNNLTENNYQENPLKSLEWKDLYVLLNELPHATRAICSLFYLEGFSINDISKQLEVSTGTVKWHLSETRKRLKPVLKKHYL